MGCWERRRGTESWGGGGIGSGREGWGLAHDIFIHSSLQQANRREWRTREVQEGVDNGWRLPPTAPWEHCTFPSLCPCSCPLSLTPWHHHPCLPPSSNPPPRLSPIPEEPPCPAWPHAHSSHTCTSLLSLLWRERWWVGDGGREGDRH